jgi:hypothetical protein
MLTFDTFQVCTSPSEYHLIRESSTGKLFRLRCFQELPEGCAMLIDCKEQTIPTQYWGLKRWPLEH